MNCGRFIKYIKISMHAIIQRKNPLFVHTLILHNKYSFANVWLRGVEDMKWAFHIIYCNLSKSQLHIQALSKGFIIVHQKQCSNSLLYRRTKWTDIHLDYYLFSILNRGINRSWLISIIYFLLMLNFCPNLIMFLSKYLTVILCFLTMYSESHCMIIIR